ncbi:hypothetical protein ACLKMH_22820 [Psychromonas sp. KJ10-10]|uniref:hypothetical protein n=1 Tax=Psychromonas sp. KJ10-10 TaxID=3391823 RepID=UPI0039B49A95
MKKKFTLHLDALLVIVLLFVVLLGLVLFQQSEINTLTLENKERQWQSLEDSLNLDSQASYIKKLQAQLEIQTK